jgi:hypothetical protein
MMDDEDNITVTAMLTYTHSSDGDPRHTPGDVVGRVVLDVTIETNKGRAVRFSEFCDCKV